MTVRPENWPNLLEGHLARWRTLPFSWGVYDCAHFVAEWVEALGHRGAVAALPSACSPLAAARYYRAHGGWEAVVAERVAAAGLEECPVRMAGRGDVAVARIDAKRQALGIVNGRSIEVLTTAGVSPFPLHACVVKSWRT